MNITENNALNFFNSLEISYRDREDIIISKLDKKMSYSHNNTINLLSGAFKMCLIFKYSNFVLKWDKYCDIGNSFLEVINYEKAVSQGLEMFFPKTIKLGKSTNGIIVILQEKIDDTLQYLPSYQYCKYKHIASTVSSKTKKKIAKTKERLNVNSLCANIWIDLAISLYGKDKVILLLNFLSENHINDLHNANIGFLHNKPVISDFSGTC